MLDDKEKDYDIKEEEEGKDIIKTPVQYEKDHYLLKIFPSKDNISLIFKLEKEKVQTYYYYAKFQINDFKNINKKFNADTHIINVFLRLKDITKNYECSLEKKILKMNLSFIKKNNENLGIFTVKKKNVRQNRINLKLVEQIQENKSKLKLIKRQLAKLDKNIQNKNDLVDNINMNIDKMTNVVNNITISDNNIENNVLEKKSNNNNNKGSNTNNNNNNKNNIKDSPLKESENEDEIKKTYKVNEKENMLLKQNLSQMKDYQQSEKEQEGKRYISNNRKKKNKDKLKKMKTMFKADEASKYDSQDDTLFCFENIDVYKNKKIYETLILFNVITVIIIMYLLCSFFTLKSNLSFQRMRDQEILKKLALLNLLENAYDEDDMDGIRDNIVDFKLKNNDDDNTDTNPKVKFSSLQKKKKVTEVSSLLKEEKDEKFYKKKLRKKYHFRVRDISFELKYNSKDAFKYKSLFNNYDNMNEILIIFKTKNKQKFSLFSNNILLKNQFVYSNNVDYTGFVYNNDQINEVDLSTFHQKYGQYLYEIYKFLEYTKNKKTHNNISYELLGDIELFEIFHVKYNR